MWFAILAFFLFLIAMAGLSLMVLYILEVKYDEDKSNH